MEYNELRDLRLAKPFFPFTIHLADGRTLDVPLGERLTMHPDNSYAHLTVDEFEVLRFERSQIVRVEVSKTPVADPWEENRDRVRAERAERAERARRAAEGGGSEQAA